MITFSLPWMKNADITSTRDFQEVFCMLNHNIENKERLYCMVQNELHDLIFLYMQSSQKIFLLHPI